MTARAGGTGTASSIVMAARLSSGQTALVNGTAKVSGTSPADTHYYTFLVDLWRVMCTVAPVRNERIQPQEL